MAALSKWKQEYERLQNFSAAHPEIKIDKSEFSIPAEVRGEFYRRFDTVRKAIVESCFPALPVDVGALCDKYIEIEKEIIELLGLESISIPVDLSSFLHSPDDGLTRVLYNSLCNLMQGKETVEAFEQQAKYNLDASAADLYNLGYEAWAALVLIKLLEPDKAFLVDIDSEDRTFQKELKDISFGRQAHHNMLRVPEFVVQSRRISKRVAVKMPVAREIDTYRVAFAPPVRPKNRTGDTSHALAPRVMLFHVMEEGDEIPIVADLKDYRISSPHIVIEFIAESELEDPDVLSETMRRCSILQPKIATYLVIRDPSKELAPEKPAETIEAVAVGLDASKLRLVVDGLDKTRS